MPMIRQLFQEAEWWQVYDLITPFGKQIDMHPALVAMAQKLYAYRGDEQAVAHGATQTPKDLSAEAELVLQMSAALIVYFVKKRESAE
jgi:hypothetical protein